MYPQYRQALSPIPLVLYIPSRYVHTFLSWILLNPQIIPNQIMWKNPIFHCSTQCSWVIKPYVWCSNTPPWLFAPPKSPIIVLISPNHYLWQQTSHWHQQIRICPMASSLSRNYSMWASGICSCWFINLWIRKRYLVSEVKKHSYWNVSIFVACALPVALIEFTNPCTAILPHSPNYANLKPTCPVLQCR